MEIANKFDVFISYRRKGGFETAKLVYYSLQQKGYRVFLDVEALRSGPFNKQLYSVIDSVSDFVLILSKDALERCKNDGDWVREEILRAMAAKKNIIPIIQNDFEFPEYMPPQMEGLEYYNGVVASIDYFDAAINKLVTMLKSMPYSPTPTDDKNDLRFSETVKIIQVLLRIKDFESVKKHCVEALRDYKNKAFLYIYQLLADAKISEESNLYLLKNKLESDSNFQLAMEFANENEKVYLQKMIKQQNEIQDDLKNITNCICSCLIQRINDINSNIQFLTSPQLSLKLYNFVQKSISESQYVSFEVEYPGRDSKIYATPEFLMTNSFLIQAYLTVHDNYGEFVNKNTIEKIAKKIVDVLYEKTNEYHEIPDINLPFIFENFKRYKSGASNPDLIKLCWQNVNIDQILFTPDKKTGVAFLSINNLRFVDISKEKNQI